MTFEPWAVGDTFPNVGSHPTATAALNADIGILTAAIEGRARNHSRKSAV